MGFVAPGKRDRRRKAAASLPGQQDLQGQLKPSPRLATKIPSPVHTLFLGLGPGLDSAKKGHYFPGGNNYFWKLLYHSGIWPEPIESEDDDLILSGGFGLADVIERPTQGSVLATKAEFLAAKARVRRLVATHRPKLVVFVGLKAYRTFMRRDALKVSYGEQVARIGEARVFVVPSTSGASVGDTSYADKLDWFKQLAATVQEARNQE